MSKSHLSRLLFSSSSIAMVACFAASGAFAQGGGNVETVVVTGSLIENSNALSDTPVAVLDAEKIGQSSPLNVEELLQKNIPSMGTGGSYASNDTPQGDGASCVDIRNLGTSRTLVLLNGRRFVHSGIASSDCVDLNNIPLQLIKGVDILKDGASSIYGADAVAGVINARLNRNFEGTVIDVSAQVPQGSGAAEEISLATGGAFGNGDRGHAVFSLDYTNRDQLRQRDRSWADYVDSFNVPAGTAGDYLPNGQIKAGSGTIPAGIITPLTGSSPRLVPNSDGTFHTLNALTDRYNFGPDQSLGAGLQKESLTALTDYKITSWATGYIDAFFTHKDTQVTQSGSNLSIGPGNGLSTLFIIPAGNPYNPYSQNVSFAQRTNYLGDRLDDNDDYTYQFNTGIKGTLPYDIDYDAFFDYGSSAATLRTYNSLNYTRWEQMVGYSATTSNPNGGVYDPTVCVAAAGCVLSNPYAPSQAAANYVQYTNTANTLFGLNNYGLALTKKDLIDLPAGPVAVALGGEHRTESGRFNPDNLLATGVAAAAINPTKGSFSVNEAYVETRIPLLLDQPLAQELTLDLSGRYFSYNTSGNGTTWKVSAVYAPVDDIRFRADLGTAFRQPNINELYAGAQYQYLTARDPCTQISTYGAAAATVGANCAAQGLPTNLTQLNNTVIPTITGGNPALTPEKARNQGIGVVLKPRWIPWLSATVDYWSTNISNAIVASLGPQTIVDGCYTSTGLSSVFCNSINGRNSLNQINSVKAAASNLGKVATNGVDFGATLTDFELDGIGSFGFDTQWQLLLLYKQQNIPNTAFVEYTGTINTATYGQAFPRLRGINTITFKDADWPLTANYSVRYISGMGFYPALTLATSRVISTPEIGYQDISFSYKFNDNLNVTVGLDNIFDVAPPYVNDATTNTDPSVYDVVGRLAFAKLSLAL